MPTSDPTAPEPAPLTRRQLREMREQQAAEPEAHSPDAAPPPVGEADVTEESAPVFAPEPTVAPEPEHEPASAPDHDPETDRGPHRRTALFAPAAEPVAPPSAPVKCADEEHAPTALLWVDPARLDESPTSEALDGHSPSLLADAPLRSAAPWSVLAAILTLIALVVGYIIALIVWPLNSVAPVATANEIAPLTTPAAEITWTEEGLAAVGVRGLGTVAQSTEAVPMASVTKVVSSLMVLEQHPLALGEQGVSYTFGWADVNEYNNYRWRGESALDVPLDGELSEYQLLQGTMISSANNYINRLVQEMWGSNSEFEAAAAEWLRERNLTGITVTEPSGISSRNTADPASLIALAELAMANPVLSEIAGTQSTTLPGAGEIINSNPLLGQSGVTGLKTGSLTAQRSGMGQDYWNLLATKELTLGDTTVLVSAGLLGYPDNETRVAEAESLFAQVESQLTSIGDAVSTGTVVGKVETLWGESADIVVDQPTRVIVWNGTSATHTIALDLGESWQEGESVGTITTSGPLDSSVSALSLASTIEGPSIWWRLTHPLELLGLR